MCDVSFSKSMLLTGDTNFDDPLKILLIFTDTILYPDNLSKTSGKALWDNEKILLKISPQI